MSIVYSKEPSLRRIAGVFSGLAWLGLLIGTAGIALFYAGIFALAYLFGHSAFISHVRGNAVEVGPDQLPDIHQRVIDCCQRLGLSEIPETFVLNSEGALNALATRFLRRDYVILYSDIIDALEHHPDSLDFYLGHEIGHIVNGHVRHDWLYAPAKILPLLGAALSRAREYTCDLHGLACCDDPKDAAYGLAVLAGGEHCWKQLNLGRYAEQSNQTGGFWMSYHELTGGYPWLTKRVKHVMSAAADSPASFPKRHPLAYLLALFSPSIGGGAGGAMASVIGAVAVIGVLAAIAVPNFMRFQTKARLVPAREMRLEVESAAARYIEDTGYLPGSLASMGLPDDASNAAIAGVEIAESGFVLHLRPDLHEAAGSRVELSPYFDEGGLSWNCSGDLEPTMLQSVCGGGAADTNFADAGPNATSAHLEANETTCDASFREHELYHAMESAARASLRERCNFWKLEQLQ